MLPFGIAIAVLYLAGIILWGACRLPTPADERHVAPTVDGWGLALYRYRPAADCRVTGEPVILCHGMLSNRFNFDLDETNSLARYLRRAGFDTWVMELRGHGRSRRLATGGNRPYDWTIDEYIRGDLPAAIDYVDRQTGGRGVHWVGHSLGGMILYAACALGLTAAVRSAVFTDTHAEFQSIRGRRRLGRLYFRWIPIVPPFLFIPPVLVMALIAPGMLLPRYGIRCRRTLLGIVANGLIGLGCSRVARHLLEVVERGRFVSADGTVDYEAGIERIHFPILQLAAACRRSPERVARALIERAPARVKEYRRLGRLEGFSEDYNHFTVLLGEHAPREVFPIISDFLGRNSRATDRPRSAGDLDQTVNPGV